ncbi:hypothetical protein Dsin_012570 [Dipteronia sinensis]|uniref:Uncharacterized protein n=1 Tax=Dipteronia sinensis TaxID=43782 RepID=A0AAE0AJ13_9ROSI|nr:hypothetical protein Dsin_012570 [Dipteronia sinensis]
MSLNQVSLLLHMSFHMILFMPLIIRLRFLVTYQELRVCKPLRTRGTRPMRTITTVTRVEQAKTSAMRMDRRRQLCGELLVWTTTMQLSIYYLLFVTSPEKDSRDKTYENYNCDWGGTIKVLGYEDGWAEATVQRITSLEHNNASRNCRYTVYCLLPLLKRSVLFFSGNFRGTPKTCPVKLIL